MYTSRHAIDPQMLNIYIKDVVGSFFLFWLMIGPVCYQVYVNKKPVSEPEEKPHEIEDTYASMLKKVH